MESSLNPQRRVLITLSGFTCSGKTTVANELCSTYSDCRRIVSSTTRTPRPDEKDGVDYHFLSRQAFLDTPMLESEEYANNLYGMSVAAVEEAFQFSGVCVAILCIKGVEAAGAYCKANGIVHYPVWLYVSDAVRRIRLCAAGRDVESRMVAEGNIMVHEELFKCFLDGRYAAADTAKIIFNNAVSTIGDVK